jgi:hypothetical protein
MSEEAGQAYDPSYGSQREYRDDYYDDDPGSSRFSGGGSGGGGGGGGGTGVSLFVGNFPFECTEDEIEKAFSEFGSTNSVRIITDRFVYQCTFVISFRRDTGKPRGFAFVEMRTMDEAQAAIDGLNDQDFYGRPLRVSLSTSKGAVCYCNF